MGILLISMFLPLWPYHYAAEASPTDWHKYEGNPTLNGSKNGFASVFYDSGIYHLFCSWNGILHFTSPNGITEWVADPNNPVLSGNNEGVPMVWKEAGVWYMLYRYGAPTAIGLANSTDATTWTRYEGNPVLTEPSGGLDPWGVIKVGSTYYLWYNDGWSTGSRASGLATSTDLKSWTKDANNPIFTGGRYCIFPFKYGGYYYMLVPYYNNFPYGIIELYRCSSPTFYAGQREYLGIVLNPGSAGAWDMYRQDTPAVLTDTIYRDTYVAAGNQLWMYYASTPDSGTSWKTGMCIEQNITDALTRLLPPTFVTHFDSTSNHNNGQANGNVNTTGIIDGASSFDGVNDYINCGDNSTLKGMNALTVEVWVKPNAIGSAGAGIVAKWASWTSGSYIMYWGSPGGGGTICWGVIPQTGSYAQISSGPAVAIGQWQHLVGVYDGAQVRLYRNASVVGTPAALTGKVMSETTPCYVGRYTTPYLNGIIDEVRISNVTRNASWITTEYNNQASPSTFYTVGTEENAPSNYTLSVSIVGQGSVNLNATGPYSYGAVVQLTAVSAVGWSFDHWSGDLSGSVNPTTILMDGNKTVTATFTQNTYSLTTSVVGSGSVNLNNSGPYHYGDVVQLTAVPAAGWNFEYWSGDLTGSANPTTLIITGDMSVVAHFSFPTLSVFPPLVEKGLGNIGSTFEVQVKIENVRDMWGFDFKLNWDHTLLTLANVEHDSSLDAIWGVDNWFTATSSNGTGFYELAAVSLKDGFNSTGSHTLATLTFRVEDPHSNFPVETLIHFEMHKLSNSQWQPIDNTAEDGTYRMTSGEKPTLSMNPTTKTCRKYGETFTVKIDASNAFNVTDFEFEIDFNTTLLNYSSITWNAWGTGTITVNEEEGKITGYSSGTLFSGQTLITVEFKAECYHIWKDLPGWVNDESGQIFIQAANLSYPGALKLRYIRGGLNEIDVGPDVTYTFSPIQGDIDNSGTVEIFDLRTIAAFYDQESPTYNLTGEATIDIFDLVVVGSNFGYTYTP